MSTPYWGDGSEEANAWNFCWIGEDLLPGVVVDFVCPNRRRLDQQPTPGRDGVKLKDTGYELTAGSVTFRMWTADQHAAWGRVRKRLDPKLRGTRGPLTILHPQAAEAGIHTVYVEEVDAGMPDSAGGRYVTIAWQEWTEKTRVAKTQTEVQREKAAPAKGTARPPIEVNVFG